MSDTNRGLDVAFDIWLRVLSRWAVLGAAVVFGATFFTFAVYAMVREHWVEEIAKEHFAATIGLPSAALGSLLLVTILEISAGQIELKGFGVEFKGAAGPIIMWVLCFLAIAAAIKLLW